MDNNRKKSELLTGYASIDNPHLVNYKEGAFEDVTDGINMRMYDFMYERNKSSLDNPSMGYFGVEVSYQEMIDKIEKYAKALKKYGIQKGDYVSICLPNIPELVYLKYAINRIGAVSNVIDPRTNPNGILERVNFCNSQLFISVLDICKSKIEPIKKDLKVSNIVTITPADSLPKQIGNQTTKTLPVNAIYQMKNKYFEVMNQLKKEHIYIGLDDLLKLEATFTGDFDVEYEENMPVTALYTSGTTASGMSAGLFSNENYNAMVKNMSYGSNYIKPGKKFLGAIPFFSAYGSFCGFHHSFSNSWNVTMVPKFKVSRYADLILESRANAALGVPAFWEQFCIKPSLRNKDTSQLEIPVTGGDWISDERIQNINQFFFETGCKVKLKIGYGATEFGGVVSTTSDDSDKYNPKSVGILLPGNSAMIIDPETKEELPYNQEGELCVSGPTMMLGYLNNQEKTDEITIYKDGKKYYRTGDKMMINEYGDLIYCDRYKRVMMRPDGHTVACSPIENTLMSSELVSNCAVVGVKLSENSSGTIPTAFVKLKKESNDLDSLKDILDQYCLENLGERERALTYVFVDKIPYTPNGKIDFRFLQNNTLEDLEHYHVDDVLFENASKKGKEKMKRR